MIIERSRQEYLLNPLSIDDIYYLQRQQREWVKTEKNWSLRFVIFLVCIPLSAIGFLSTWPALLMGMVVTLIAYMWFKLQLPNILDKKFPCEVIVEGESRVKPYCNGLIFTPLQSESEEAKAFMKQISKKGRTALKFEAELFK